MMEEFFPWEEKYGLIGDTVEGFAYWNYMRRDLFKSFRDDMDGIVSPFFRNLEESGQKKSFVKRLSLALRMLRMPGRTGKKDIDVLFLCHPRRTEIDGKLFSIYTDPLTEVFPNSVSVERASPERAKGTPFSPNLIYLDRLELFSMLFQMGMARFRKKRNREIRGGMAKR